MRQIRNQYKVVWYQVMDDEGRKLRRFETLEEAEGFAEEWETIQKVTLTREAYVPEEAPF
jgi:hypothetical protein